jgi:hypothetical protein
MIVPERSPSIRVSCPAPLAKQESISDEFADVSLVGSVINMAQFGVPSYSLFSVLSMRFHADLQQVVSQVLLPVDTVRKSYNFLSLLSFMYLLFT